MDIRRWGSQGGGRRFIGWASRHVDILLLAIVVFLLPLFFWPGATEYNYARSIFLLISVAILAIVRALAAARRGGHAFPMPWLAIPVLGLVIASLLSLAHAAHTASVLQSLALLLGACVFALLVIDAVRKPAHATILLTALSASATVVAVHAMLQYAGLVPGMAEPGAASMITTLGNPDIVAGFLACALFPSIALVRRARPLALRIIASIPPTASLAAILLTGQLGVLLALAAGLAFLLLASAARPARAPRRRRILLAVFLCVVGAAVLVPVIGGVLGPSRPVGAALHRLWIENSGVARSVFWDAAWMMWRDHPLTGVGLGNYKIVYPEYEARVFARSGPVPSMSAVGNAAQAHNDYLQAAGELGTPGLVAVAALLVLFAVSLVVRVRGMRASPGSSGERTTVLLVASGVIVFCGHAVVGFPAHLAAPAATAVLLGAIVLSPAFGSAAAFTVRIGRRAAWAMLVGASLLGLAICVFAARDLAANVLQLRGARLVQVGQDYEALQTLEKSLSLDLAPRETYFHLASAQYRLGHFQDALDSLALCIAVFPDDTATLQYADLAAGLGHLDQALETLDVLLAGSPTTEHAVKARYVRALVLREKGDPPAAEAALREIVAGAPDYEPALIALGDLAAQRGARDEAREVYQQALALIERELPTSRIAAAGAPSQTYDQYSRARARLEELNRERSHILQSLGEL